MATVAPPQKPPTLPRANPIQKSKSTPMSIKFFENKFIKILGFFLWAFLVGLRIYHSVQEGRGAEIAKWAGITSSVLVPVVYTLMGGGIVLSATQSTLLRFMIGAFILFIVGMRMYTNIKDSRGEDPPKWVSGFNSSFNLVIIFAMIAYGFFFAKGQNRVRLLLLGILLIMDTGLDIFNLIKPPRSEPEPSE